MTRGYSLIEMLVVLAIMGLLIALAAPEVQAGVERLTLRNDARAVMTSLRRLRETALDTQSDIALQVSRGHENDIEVSNGSVIALTPGTRVTGAQRVLVGWDGTISGAFVLERGGARVRVSGAPLTGRLLSGDAR